MRACVRACVRACTHTDQVLCVELVLGFWSDQSETYTYWKYMGWSFAPPLGGDVDSSVCLWEASELRSPQHLTNPSDFFQCFVLNSSKGFGRINLKPIQIEYIWVEVVDLSLGAMSVRPFVCDRCRNLGPHSILLIRVIFPKFYPELVLGFWSDQFETYTDFIYMGWSCAPPLGGGVAPSVFLREGSELSPPPPPPTAF